MQITISNVDVQDKGKYQQAVVNYTTKEGKAEKKNVMSFKNKALYSTLSTAQPGDVYDVQLGKNEQGYWEFTSATKGQGGVQAQAGNKTQASPAPRSTYETPEERAARQVYIIRQSSLSTALGILSVGAKGVKVNDVLATAKVLEDYVFGKASDPTSISEFVEDTFEVGTIE